MLDFHVPEGMFREHPAAPSAIAAKLPALLIIAHTAVAVTGIF